MMNDMATDAEVAYRQAQISAGLAGHRSRAAARKAAMMGGWDRKGRRLARS
jgi:hypothetical protein